MAATLAQLGARTLRKIGAQVVAFADRPGLGPTFTAAGVAALATRQLGVLVPEASRPALTTVVSENEIAVRTLRAVGLNPIMPGTTTGFAQTGVNPVTAFVVAANALRAVGVNPADLATGGLPTGNTSTSAQVATRALLKIAIYASDETPSTTDQIEAQQKVNAVHDQLVTLDYVTWALDMIPDHAVEFYIVMAGELLAREFGKPSSAETYDVALEALRVQALSGTTAQTRAVNKVAAVFAETVVLGLADWSLNTIPGEVAETMTTMTAALLAPVHQGKPVDMAVYAAGLASIRRTVLSGPRGLALALAKVQATHDSLIVDGIVAWPATAIPQAYAEDYVAIAAGMLAPVMGQADDAPTRQITQAERDAARNRIRQGVMDDGLNDRALAKVRAVHDELSAMGLVSWDLSTIPAGASDAYAGMVASMLAPDMGKDSDPKAMEMGLARVRMIAMNGPAGQALAEQKVLAVHESLDARGRTRWTLYGDMPAYAEEPYVLMAAALLAPEFGKPVDPAWEPKAEMDLMRIVSIPTRYQPVAVDYF